MRGVVMGDRVHWKEIKKEGDNRGGGSELGLEVK